MVVFGLYWVEMVFVELRWAAGMGRGGLSWVGFGLDWVGLG